LQGDLGYWLVPAGIPDVATPDEPSFSAAATFSRGIVLGSYTLVVRAVNDAGDFGPRMLTYVERPRWRCGVHAAVDDAPAVRAM
jgi:hypothetical protein